ncbi:putative beta-glucosidase M [Escovopsis weberi]|uniref:beta-glucosidase n=1 Tax=Escovopsis weberi TaxID=150374 RepID=A0A0M9VXC3_ESCWE|nr:putative beta-glucosidase M [Escovopsis weberi]
MRAAQDGTAMFNDFETANPSADPTSDVCIVFGNTWACEGHDRPTLNDNFTDSLINSVADSCSNTIVVFHNSGVRLVDGFVNHPNVTAIIMAHLPGEQSGPALPEARFKMFPQSDFDEGVYLDYRDFERRNVTPRYEFGFGLSYTTFDFDTLSVAGVAGANTEEWPVGPIISGGQADLWDAVVTVKFRVRNTGSVAGAEVAQLYVEIPGAPKSQLRGFEKVYLLSGEATEVTLTLTRRDLSVWDVHAQKWKLQGGAYKFWVGNSSRKLPLEADWTLSC